MARFAVTAVFEVGPGKVPRGADVLERASIPAKPPTGSAIATAAP